MNENPQCKPITIEVFHTAFEPAPRHVASLESTEPLEAALLAAFRGTQNNEAVWVQARGQDGVRVTPTQDVLDHNVCRSTCVGDYFRVVDAQGTESFFRCCDGDWKPITSKEELRQVGPAAVFATYGLSVSNEELQIHDQRGNGDGFQTHGC